MYVYSFPWRLKIAFRYKCVPYLTQSVLNHPWSMDVSRLWTYCNALIIPLILWQARWILLLPQECKVNVMGNQNSNQLHQWNKSKDWKNFEKLQYESNPKKINQSLFFSEWELFLIMAIPFKILRWGRNGMLTGMKLYWKKECKAPVHLFLGTLVWKASQIFKV